ncbi:MAG: Polyribonucleotide nucleotidyltransferase [Mycoplasmataceae bacterium]|nr:MAG: Polyribonucleotide nucleotidyltransferase [Mycoplasmataceae bacterium]
MNFINDNTEKKFSFNFQGKEISFEFDSLSLRGNKSVICRYGNTTILTTLCLKDLEEDLDFVRLTIFLDEKFYSIGKIPSGFNKRENRSGCESILISRLVDHSIRSCFSVSDKKEIQITNTILSLDENYDPKLVSCWNSFLVSLLSEDLSFNKLLSTVIVAKVGNEFICNPSSEQLRSSPFELIVTATKEKILMLEMFSGEISEEQMKEASKFAISNIGEMIDKFSSLLTDNLLEKKLKLKIFKDNLSENKDFNKIKLEIDNFISEIFSIEIFDWNERKKNLELFLKSLLKKYSEIPSFEIENFWYSKLKKKVSNDVLTKNKRIDGRNSIQIRDLKIAIDYLPGVHGSSLFSRGNTNVISVLTFGKTNDRQLIDEAFFYAKASPYKYFIHHYNFPSFAVNHLSSFKSISRREIGHGQLVEKTFSYLIPSIDYFPYATRLVSEVVSSEGSSSQASICASSLSMMASGFPLKKHVAGIALGMINGVVITDINDYEDKLGDIDFKIAGTEDGICSLQLDVKNGGITIEELYECLYQAKVARLLIIKKMNSIISSPRKSLPKQIIKCKKIYFGSNKLGMIIGQGGKNINLITSKTGVKVDFQDDGFALVYHDDENKITEAHEMMRRSIVIKSKL